MMTTTYVSLHSSVCYDVDSDLDCKLRMSEMQRKLCLKRVPRFLDTNGMYSFVPDD